MLISASKQTYKKLESKMDEVKLLMLEAWALARKNGVIIEAVDFEIIDTLGGKPTVSEINIEARLDDKKGA